MSLPGRIPQSTSADFCDQTSVRGNSTAVVVNAHVIDAFDKIVHAFFKTRYFVPDAMLQAAVDCHTAQQPTCVSLAFSSVWSERFDFGVINVAAQDVAQTYDIYTRKLVQSISLAIVRVDAKRMRPTLAFLAERREQREFQLVACSRVQDKSEWTCFALHLIQIMWR